MPKQFPLEVVLRLMDRVTPGLVKAQNNLQAFGRKAGEIGSFISTRIGLPLAGFGVLAARTTANIEERFGRLFAFTDFDEAGRDKIRGIIESVAKARHVLRQDLIDPARELLLEGGAAENLESILRSVVDLAQLEDVPVADALETITLAADRLDRKVSDAGLISDLLFGTRKNTSTAARDIVEALEPVAPMLKAMQIESSEAMAVLGALIDRGVRPSAAGTGLFQILRRLSGSDFKSLADLVESIEGKVGQVDAQKSLDTFNRLIAAGADESEAARLAFGGASKALKELVDAFGRGTPAMLELLGIGSGGIRSLQARIERAGVGEAAARIFEGLPDSIKRLGEAWEGFKNKLGSSPAVLQVVEAMGNLLGFVDKLSPATIKWASSIGLAAIALGPILRTLDLLIRHPIFAAISAGVFLVNQIEAARGRGSGEWLQEIREGFTGTGPGGIPKWMLLGAQKIERQQSDRRITVDFKNLPRGAIVRPSGPGVDVEVGYAMGEAGG